MLHVEKCFAKLTRWPSSSVLTATRLKLRDVLQLPGAEDEQEVPNEGLAPDAGQPTMFWDAPGGAGPAR